VKSGGIEGEEDEDVDEKSCGTLNDITNELCHEFVKQFECFPVKLFPFLTPYPPLTAKHPKDSQGIVIPSTCYTLNRIYK